MVSLSPALSSEFAILLPHEWAGEAPFCLDAAAQLESIPRLAKDSRHLIGQYKFLK